MKISEAVKPISYLKTHASEIINRASHGRTTMIITKNGEAKVVLQDIRAYEETLAGLALLKILAQSRESVKKGRYKPLKKAFRDLRLKINHQFK